MDTNNSNTNPSSPTPPSGQQKNTGMAILCYLSILVFVPFLSDAKNDPFVKFHIKQGLVLFIGEVIGWVIIAIPFFGWVLSPLIEIVLLIFLIIGIMNAANGQTKELPLIGHLASNFNF
jgi:uncharacterized membrane protein